MPRRKRILIFVSYARANKELTHKFLEKFKEQLAPSKTYEYKFWKDDDILVGENWDEEITKAISKSDLGLLLISPAFLGSQYITKKELPGLLKNPNCLLVPVMLQSVDFELHDLKGLRKRQVFRLDRDRFKSPKSFGDCVGNQRNLFVQALFVSVERRLKNK